MLTNTCLFLLSIQYSARSANRSKADANWGKRSQYLLAEIVKYESYIESLKSAMKLRLQKQGEKALERALASSSEEEPVSSTKGRWKGHPDAETIEESEEPPPSATRADHSPSRSQFHRREQAEA